MFKPGQMVACAPADDDTDYWGCVFVLGDAMPQAKRIYTISQVIPRCEANCGQMHVDLEELESPFVSGYLARWFKPVAPTSIEVFHQALQPTDQVQA